VVVGGWLEIPCWLRPGGGGPLGGPPGPLFATGEVSDMGSGIAGTLAGDLVTGSGVDAVVGVDVEGRVGEVRLATLLGVRGKRPGETTLLGVRGKRPGVGARDPDCRGGVGFKVDGPGICRIFSCDGALGVWETRFNPATPIIAGT